MTFFIHTFFALVVAALFTGVTYALTEQGRWISSWPFGREGNWPAANGVVYGLIVVWGSAFVAGVIWLAAG